MLMHLSMHMNLTAEYIVDVFNKLSEKCIFNIFMGVCYFPAEYGNGVLIYIQQDATLHSLFYLRTALHVSGGTTTHQQEHKQLCLQHLVFVKLSLLIAAIVEDLELV